MPRTAPPAFTPPSPLPPSRPRPCTHLHPRRRPPTATATTPRPAPSPAPFNWRRQWYPLALVRNLPTAAPTRVTVLATHLVVWRAAHAWAVFHDRCPHRLAALSEGRIAPDGSLECGYHGWQFAPSGSCLRIPQQPASPPAPAACASPLPTAERNGILFAWLGDRPPADHEQPAALDDPRGAFASSHFERTLPLCFSTLVQNVLDPAHIHFAHHGALGRRELASPIPIRILSPSSATGFTADYYDGTVRVRFRPPCLVELVTSAGLAFAYYAVPVRAGLVRTIAIRSSARRPLLRVPEWLEHLRRNALLEQDLQLMRTQQEAMRADASARTHGNYPAAWGAYHMPTTADRLVLEMRRWLAEHAPPQGEAGWYGFPHGEEAADAGRMHSHVKTCAACSAALARLEAAGRTALVVAAGGTVGSALAPEQLQRALFLAPALVGAAVWAACERLKRGFE